MSLALTVLALVAVVVGVDAHTGALHDHKDIDLLAGVRKPEPKHSLDEFRDRSEAYDFAELEPAVMRAVEWLTDMTLDREVFFVSTEGICDSWLRLYAYRGHPALRTRALQMLQLIGHDYAGELKRDTTDDVLELDAQRVHDVVMRLHAFQLMRLTDLLKREELDRDFAQAVQNNAALNDTAWVAAGATPTLDELREALQLTLHLDRVGLPHDGYTMDDVMDAYRRLRPALTAEPPTEDARGDIVTAQALLAAQFVYTVSDNGLYKNVLPDAEPETKALRAGLHHGIVMGNVDVVGECLNALGILGVPHTDADVVLGQTMLLRSQNEHGHWLEPNPNFPPVHESLAALLGFIPHAGQPSLDRAEATVLPNATFFSVVLPALKLGQDLPVPDEHFLVDPVPAHHDPLPRDGGHDEL